MSSGSGVCECWRLTPEGIHGWRACPFYGMHWSEVAALLDRTDGSGHVRGCRAEDGFRCICPDRTIRCPKCGGMNGEHGLVHTRHGNGGGSNSPCPNRTIGASEHDRDRMGICRRCGHGITAAEILDGEQPCVPDRTIGLEESND